ncbi:SulP family inorganic anion transporter [Clostridium intestinale]|uniref:SulP family inorganic anion transporter n=1 Tax=Clostridium intestinale TaxID=36845 RepID=UPI002DD61EFF|nr:sulfate permease [Clostridium intestinale]WRY53546.1 sulfate permease [Clostridium intestinale]
MLVPKLFTCIKNYNKQQFLKDLSSGIIVAIIALPLSIALAIASGVSPEKGLYTAIIGGFIVSFLGGSKVQIGGPTGAFVIIVYGIIEKYGLDGLIISTIMAGLFLTIMGFLKLGSLIRFIPASITSGFTSGIAVVIFSTQIKDFLGLSIKSAPSEFIHKWGAYFKNLNTFNPQSLLISLLTLGCIIFWPKINKKIPGAFLAIILTTVITLTFNLDTPTIGSVFGNLSSSLPSLSIPSVNLSTILNLVFPALTIAILAAVESLLSAVVADNMIDGRHRSNMELVAQGFANIFSGLFGGIPVTGAIARTAANIKNGGRTPVAGMVHSVILLLIMFLFMPYVKLIPMASLAAILVMVSYNMGEWDAFKNLLKAPKSDSLIFIVTFLLTVFFDLVFAIGVGVVLSSLLFMRKMAEFTSVKSIIDDIDSVDLLEIKNTLKYPEDVAMYEINGPFFFGATDKFISAIRDISSMPKILIIKMDKVPIMDSTAYHSFEMLLDICNKQNTKLLLLNVQPQPLNTLKKYGFVDKIGNKNVCVSLNDVINQSNYHTA